MFKTHIHIRTLILYIMYLSQYSMLNSFSSYFLSSSKSFSVWFFFCECVSGLCMNQSLWVRIHHKMRNISITIFKTLNQVQKTHGWGCAPCRSTCYLSHGVSYSTVSYGGNITVIGHIVSVSTFPWPLWGDVWHCLLWDSRGLHIWDVLEVGRERCMFLRSAGRDAISCRPIAHERWWRRSSSPLVVRVLGRGRVLFGQLWRPLGRPSRFVYPHAWLWRGVAYLGHVRSLTDLVLCVGWIVLVRDYDRFGVEPLVHRRLGFGHVGTVSLWRKARVGHHRLVWGFVCCWRRYVLGFLVSWRPSFVWSFGLAALTTGNTRLWNKIINMFKK